MKAFLHFRVAATGALGESRILLLVHGNLLFPSLANLNSAALVSSQYQQHKSGTATLNRNVINNFEPAGASAKARSTA